MFILTIPQFTIMMWGDNFNFTVWITLTTILYFCFIYYDVCIECSSFHFSWVVTDYVLWLSVAEWRPEGHVESSISQQWNKTCHWDTSAQLYELQLLPATNVCQTRNGLKRCPQLCNAASTELNHVTYFTSRKICMFLLEMKNVNIYSHKTKEQENHYTGFT